MCWVQSPRWAAAVHSAAGTCRGRRWHCLIGLHLAEAGSCVVCWVVCKQTICNASAYCCGTCYRHLCRLVSHALYGIHNPGAHCIATSPSACHIDSAPQPLLTSLHDGDIKQMESPDSTVLLFPAYQCVVGKPGAVDSHLCVVLPWNSTSNQLAIPWTAQGAAAGICQHADGEVFYCQGGCLWLNLHGISSSSARCCLYPSKLSYVSQAVKGNKNICLATPHVV